MGLDLTLLPVESEHLAFSHTVLSLDRRSDMWEKIKLIPQITRDVVFYSFMSRVPDGKSEGEKCYGVVKEDAYGNPIKWANAGDVVKAMEEYYESVKDLDWIKYDCRNQAVLAYLKVLPANRLVVLYWH